MVFSCNVMNIFLFFDVVIRWNMSDIYILIWNFILNFGWNIVVYFMLDVFIICKIKFDSII